METADNLINNETARLTGAIGTDSVPTQRRASQAKPLVGAYVALLLFILFYFSRPEDWIPGLAVVPIAKIAGGLALLALLFSLKQLRSSLPREVIYLILLVGQLFLAAAMSPVWRGGALQTTLNFAKVPLVVAVMSVVVITASRLRRLIFIQAASVATIAAVAVWKGQLVLGRLEGILGGNYADPNDMALAITVSLPLCLALLLLSRTWLWRTFWLISMLVMVYAVLLTGSRGGFLALLVVAAVCLWELAIRGRRRYLLVLTGLAGFILLMFSGGMLVGRLKGTFDVKEDTAAAYGSAQARQQLFWRSIDVTKEHLLFGVGPGNFDEVSGQWHTTHNSLTLMSSEGGVPALVLYVLILSSGFKNLSAAKRLARGQTESSLLARALLASLAGYAVGSIFLSVAYAFFPYILVAYTTALLSITRRSAAQVRKFERTRQKGPEKQFHLQAAQSEIAFLGSETLSSPRFRNS